MELNGQRIYKPFVEKPVSGEDHNIWVYYPHSMVRRREGVTAGETPYLSVIGHSLWGRSRPGSVHSWNGRGIGLHLPSGAWAQVPSGAVLSDTGEAGPGRWRLGRRYVETGRGRDGGLPNSDTARAPHSNLRVVASSTCSGRWTTRPPSTTASTTGVYGGTGRTSTRSSCPRGARTSRCTRLDRGEAAGTVGRKECWWYGCGHCSGDCTYRWTLDSVQVEPQVSV